MIGNWSVSRSMGIHRSDETGQSIRKRRMSRNRESLELQQMPTMAQKMEDLGPLPPPSPSP